MNGRRPRAKIEPVQTPTLRDVAQLAGVHAATASRALNPKTRPLVNADTARKVLRAAESLGYQPNPIARSLKTSKSSTVGLVIPDLTNPLFPPIVRGIEDVLRPAGYNAWIVNTDNDPAREESQIESLRSRQVEGLIVATARLDHPLLKNLHEQGMKIVLVNRRVEGVEIPSITADDSAGVAMAVQHLVDLGHRRIAHLAGPQTTSTGVVRARAFRHAIRDHGLADDPSLIAYCDYWTETEGARALRGLLDAGRDFTAVVAGNDLIALGCYDVFAERGHGLPGRHQRRRLQRDAVPGQDAPAADHDQPAALRDRHRGGPDAAGSDRRPGPRRPLRAAADLARRPGVHRPGPEVDA